MFPAQNPGVCVVSGEKLRSIVRTSGSDTVLLTESPTPGGDGTGTLIVRDESGKFTLYTQVPADFPLAAEDASEEKLSVRMEAEAFHDMLSAVKFAVASEGTRYAFNGALLELAPSGSRAVATDGRRLAVRTGPGVEVKEPARAILPMAFMRLVEKAVPRDGHVDLRLKHNTITARAAGVSIASVLVEGQFPPVDDVIPKPDDSYTTVTAALGDLLSAVKRAGLMTTEESKGIRIEYGKAGLVLRSRAAEAGEAEVNFACRVEGPEGVIGMNPAFIGDLAKSGVRVDEVTVSVVAPNRPALFRMGPDFQYVLMPVNLEN